MRRRDVLMALAAAPLVPLEAAVTQPVASVGVVPQDGWPLLRAYLRTFVTSDGRVVDLTAGGHSTSEGQAYALFFALVGGDRRAFDSLLGWTVDNLADGDLAARLPAWRWGKGEGGSWGVTDPNSASDADLWIAYCLLEGGRLWRNRALGALGRALLDRVAEQEVVDLPGLGPMILPGASGFALPGDRWRLNPSYLPLQLLERARTLNPAGPWGRVKAGAVRLIRESAPHDLVPDWVIYSPKTGFSMDPVTGDLGSFDAIRCTLWAAMLDDDEPHKGVVAGRCAGLARQWRRLGKVPATVQPWTGGFGGGRAPVGFLGALLPEIDTWSDPGLSARVREQIEFEKNGDLYSVPAEYYDHNLLLFGLGYGEHRYRFEADGRLVVGWRPR